MFKKLILAAALFAPLPAAAATVFELTATSDYPAHISGFTLTFEDTDNDSLFSMDELLDFGGIDYLIRGTSYQNLVEAPELARVADGVSSTWIFSSNSQTPNFHVSANVFTYQLSAVSGAVPLPASALLLLGALGGLAATRRRKS